MKTYYVVEMQKGRLGKEVEAPEGYSEEEAYALAMSKYPDYEIVGHHIEWVIPKNQLH